jgi:hypothetical protein
MATITAPNPNYTITINSTATNWPTGSITVPSTYSFNGSNGSTWASTNITTSSPTHHGLKVTGDTDIEGNLTVQGKDIVKILETVEKRLAILTPNPKKLKKFEALQKAYDHYKLLEALCHSEDDDD